MNTIQDRIDKMNRRVRETRLAGLYFYLQPLEELEGTWVTANNKRMLMFASYSYLNLLGHPKIEAAARDALASHGTGTHGVRILAGTLPLHEELERKIARFKRAATSNASAASAPKAHIRPMAAVRTLPMVYLTKHHAGRVDTDDGSQAVPTGQGLLQFVELILADVAHRADPVLRQILEGRSGWDAAHGIAGLWVVDVGTVGADVPLHVSTLAFPGIA